MQSLEQSLVEERERIAILEGAREAAVQDIKGLLSEQRNLTFALKAESEMVSDLRASLDESKVRKMPCSCCDGCFPSKLSMFRACLSLLE